MDWTSLHGDIYKKISSDGDKIYNTKQLLLCGNFTAAGAEVMASGATMDQLCSSSAGSGGVLFARLATGTVVIKGCSTVAQEYVAATVGQALEMPVPGVRLISWPSREYNELQEAVNWQPGQRMIIAPTVLMDEVDFQYDKSYCL